jgi:hypothetical protein
MVQNMRGSGSKIIFKDLEFIHSMMEKFIEANSKIM